MAASSERRRSAVIFGARNLGRAVIEELRAEGWAVTGVATSATTLEGITESGALALPGDVTDPGSVTEILGQAAAAHGGVDLVVNAASIGRADRSGPFGGGPIAEAQLQTFDSWAMTPARAAFSFLSATGRFLVAAGAPATVVQVTGGSARRVIAGRGAWAAGAYAVRALTQATALELRDQGIHVALLVVDAGIQPLTGSHRAGAATEQLADPRELAGAVLFLADQGARGATHELVVTPLAERWVP